MYHKQIKVYIKSCGPIFLLLSLIYVMYVPIRTEILCIADNLFGKIPKNDETRIRTLIFIFIAGISIVRFIYDLILKNRYITLISFVNFSILFIIYILFRRDNRIAFIMFDQSMFALNDILFLFLFVFCSDYIVNATPLYVNNQFIIEDDVSESTDLLGRERYVENVAKAINSSVGRKSIGISINAEWGFGKTFFLKKVESELVKNVDNIIIWFNPWDRELGRISIDLFFDELELALRPYSSKVSKQIRRYSEHIMKPEEGDSLFMNLGRRAMNALIPDLSMDEQKSSINKIIERSGKRIVVFIDDLDRLNGTEISNVMQLIRNSADFANTFFVVALDRSYVTNSLPASSFVYDGGRYLEKIFQMEIILPPIRSNVRKSLLINLFSQFYGSESNEYQEIKSGIERISSDPNFQFIFEDRGNINILEVFLENIRDVKRFVNSFNMAYSMIKGDINVEEFLLLELIKYKSSSFYRFIVNGDMLENTDIFHWRWQFSTEKFAELRKKKLKLFAIPDAYLPVFKRAMLHLYPRGQTSEVDQFGNRSEPYITPATEDSVVYKKNHAKYFNYNLFGDFSIKEFKSAIQQGIDASIGYVDLLSLSSTSEHNSVNVLKNYLQYLERYNFDTLPDYQLGLCCFLHCVSLLSERNIDSIFTEILTKQKVVKYFGDENYFEAFGSFLIDNIFLNERLSLRRRIELIVFSVSVTDSTTRRQDYQFLPDRNRLVAPYRSIFTGMLESTNSKEQDVFFMMHSGITLRLLTESDREDYRRYLNGHSNFFIKSSLFPRMVPYEGFWEFQFFPYRDEIFGGDIGFLEFLASKPDNSCAQYISGKFREMEGSSSGTIIIRDYNDTNPCI